jgi:hypothetical protein
MEEVKEDSSIGLAEWAEVGRVGQLEEGTVKAVEDEGGGSSSAR